MTDGERRRLDVLLKAKALGENPRQLDDFLRAQIPRFAAPTDPAEWKREIGRLRREALAKVYLRGIPASVVRTKPRVVWGEVLRPHPSYVVRKLRYEAYPDYWIPALLYEPARLRGRVPAVLNPNGHHRGGKAVLYKQARCANLARRGALALSIEFIGMSELEADCFHNNIAHLNLTGMAGVGLFYLALKKGLDALLAHRWADPERVCVTGLSGGGWQTIVISALDPRVTMSVPVAGYTTMRTRIDFPSDRGDQEQMPVDLTTVFDYDGMTAMLAPRPALLILNEKDDCCFMTDRTRPVIYTAVKPTYRAMGAEENLQTHNNRDPGTHNYDADNRRQLYAFLAKHFGLAGPAHDVHGEREILTEDALRVGLPLNQKTMLDIARERAVRLAAAGRRPVKTAAQRRRLREILRHTIRLPSYGAEAELVRRSGSASLLTARTGPWALPLTIQDGPRGVPPVLAIGDRGRAAPMPPAGPSDGARYVADILGTGELQYTAIFLSMIDAAGSRLLGVQVAQVLALARLAARQYGVRRVHLVGDGWNSCFVLLVAAAIEPRRFVSLTSCLPMTTLRHAIQWPLRFEEAPSLFCFGLLKVADIPEIRALMEGVEFRAPGRCVLPA